MSEYCVFAMHTGVWPRPTDSRYSIARDASGAYSTPSPPYARRPGERSASATFTYQRLGTIHVVLQDDTVPANTIPYTCCYVVAYSTTGTGRYDALWIPGWFLGDFVVTNSIIPIDKYFNDPRFAKITGNSTPK